MAESGEMAESKPDWVEPLSQALVSIVDGQREHSRALTILLERMDSSQAAGPASHSQRSEASSEAVKWPTLAAILSALFLPLALVLGMHWAIISGMGTKVDYWSAEHDRTFGPLATDHASMIDRHCARLQILEKNAGIESDCDRSLRPWPNGDRGGR